MKTFKVLFLFLATCCLGLLLVNCNRQKTPKMVTVDFIADGLGEYKYVGPDTLPSPRCTGELSFWRAIVEVSGTGSPMGEFTVFFDFCGDSLSNYGNMEAYMVTSDDDTLFIDGIGKIVDGRLDDHPDYVTSYWNDMFSITGGTGKYKGASGEIKTNDFNSSEDYNSHHHWAGTITMMESKK